jgi:hypothetical protein
MKTRIWKPEEYEYIKNNYETKDDAEIAKDLKRSESAVRQIRWSMGLKTSKHFWSERNEKYLIENWRTQTDEELAKNLKKTKFAVQNKRTALGLIRTKGPAPSAPKVELPKKVEIVATGESRCPRTDCPFNMSGGCSILKPPVGAEDECGFYPPTQAKRKQSIIKSKSYRRSKIK